MQEILQLVIDDEWKETVKWLIPHVYDEDDPSSYKYILKRRRSQDLRLNRLLSQLVIKTEVFLNIFNGECPHLISYSICFQIHNIL